MSTAAMTLGWRPRPRLGPALRRFRLPFLPLAVSATAHLAFALALVAGAAAWRAAQPRTYVVNLVPAVAAVGVPQGRPTPVPSLPPRVAEPTSLPPRAEKPESKALPEPAPSMPPRTRESVGLPDRALPPRTAALPRPGDKELPSLAAPPRPRTPAAREPAPAAPSAPRREPAPPPALGRPGGSSQGSGALTLNVGDFPFAWYLRRVQAKIEETWRAPMSSREGQDTVAVFEIMPDGQVRHVTVEKSSGDPVYDQAALRAIAEANPFPPLPEDFRQPPLRIHLGFTYRGRS
jgi:TonB family protein